MLATVLLCLPLAAANANAGLPPPPDRSTPAATAEGFTELAHSGDYAGASHYLDLDHIPKAQQASEGPRLARRLRFVIDRKLFLDFNALRREDAPEPGGSRYEVLGSLPLGNAKQPIRLYRTPGAEGPIWLFSEDTVRAIDRLYEAYGPPLGEVLPAFWFENSFAELELWQWVGLLLVLTVSTLLAWMLGWLFVAVSKRMVKLTAAGWDDKLAAGARGPVRLLLWCALVAAGTRVLYLSPGAQHVSDLVARSTLIVAITLFALRAITTVAQYVQTEVKTTEGRRLRTQVSVLRGVLQVAIYVVASALFLMQFAVVRSVGVSLLASAGIAGLVIGVAAQKSISSLLAGIQLSLTQPIQIGDSVVIEGETGTVAEINLTYVVVQVWDQRRLIIPITQFLEKPFQNWSRGADGMLGAVELQVDFRVDVDVLRAEVTRLLNQEAKSLWDGRVQNVAVTGSTDKSMLLRILVSAADAGKSFDLRCLLREKVIAFIGKQPAWLPTVRSEQQSREVQMKV